MSWLPDDADDWRWYDVLAALYALAWLYLGAGILWVCGERGAWDELTAPRREREGGAG